jgi:FKBP-type peptidyl-prolyl cis-trans isomerase FkpA
MERGSDYLAKIDAEKGVKALPSGLRIKIERPGQGVAPTAADTVKVHYAGRLIDGKEFDSSYKRGAPATFPLGGVIPCWTEGVQMLKPGGKATLYCPSKIAYGREGHPPVIPGGATLIFEVELLGVLDSKTGEEKKSAS